MIFQSRNLAPMLENKDLSYTLTESLKRSWQINITPEYYVIYSWDKKHHNINIETSLKVRKIIQA